MLLWTPSWKEQAQDEKLVILLPEELLELEEEPSWEEQEQDGKLVLLLPKELIEFEESLEVEELWKSIEKWKD